MCSHSIYIVGCSSMFVTTCFIFFDNSSKLFVVAILNRLNIFEQLNDLKCI